MRTMPKYPVYVPSSGRFEACQTAKCLIDGGVPFYLVVQPAEAKQYEERFPGAMILQLPWNNDREKKNGLLLARNWIREHAESTGAERHWQIDDNIIRFARRWKLRIIECDPGIALRCAEDFTDRFENVGISGLNYEMFCPARRKQVPFVVNCHVYSCSLINHAMKSRWRLNYNDDTDICLQAIAEGWCTILINVFCAKKMATMVVKGGNTDELYKINDGRLRMARTLERVWPRVVTIDRRFRRPQHVIHSSWRRFKTQLKLKPGVDPNEPPNEYGMELVQEKQIKSPEIKELFKKHKGRKRNERTKDG